MTRTSQSRSNSNRPLSSGVESAGVQSTQGGVPLWYHKVMAMNLRVPEDLDRRLEKLAAEEHTSKSALLLQGAELVLQRHARRREISEGLDFVMSHDAELLKRLEDA
jgi:Ribbon-helix-helix protein, copG family